MRNPFKKPKLVIDLSGGLIQSIVTDTDIDVYILDYEDVDEDSEPGLTVNIDGENLAYVFSSNPVEVDPTRTHDLFAQIEKREEPAENA